jgi:sugar/nucleoside kinase (ribokinase family)
MAGRRGVVTAGTWCVDLNKSIPLWPAEDTMTTVVEVDRQGGGSGCNMAIDLKRLDPALPVATMGLVGDDGDGRFLLAECDRYGIDRTRLAVAERGLTASTDCFNSKASGRRTHFYAPGVAARMSPDHFEFAGMTAHVLHLGLPGAHETMDAPWGQDSTGWATVLRKARAAGLKTNLEMVSTQREDVARFGRSCLPFLDLLIVNDYEIGCVAGIETREEGRAAPAKVAAALKRALEMGPLEFAVAHFPEGAIAATRDGLVSLGSVALPPEEIVGVNGAGDAFAAGVLYGWCEEMSLGAALRLGHACAAASMRAVSTTQGVGAVAECLALVERYGLRVRPLASAA